MSVPDPELLEPLNLITETLIDHATYHISLNNILKIAEALGYSTFIDDSVGMNDLKLKRLTIAGTIILIDIDFNDSEEIVKVSMSLATDYNKEQQQLEGTDTDSDVNMVTTTNNDLQLDLESSTAPTSVASEASQLPTQNLFFIGKTSSPSAKSILFNNLNPPTATLLDFTKNLHLLSNFDRLSLSNHANENFDLFNYINEISKKLYEKYFFDYSTFSGDSYEKFDLQNGYSKVGKPTINIFNQVGFFLKIWQDNRFINEKMQDQSILGSDYYLKFDFTSTDSNPLMYTDKLWLDSNEWNYNDDDYKPIVDLNSVLNVKILPGWVWFPLNVLESLELRYSQDETTNEQPSKEQIQIDELYKGIIDGESKSCKFNSSTGTIQLNLESNFDLNMTKLASIDIAKLYQLDQIVPKLRNWLILNNVLVNIFKFMNNQSREKRTLSVAGDLNVNLLSQLNTDIRLEDLFSPERNESGDLNNIETDITDSAIQTPSKLDKIVNLSIESDEEGNLILALQSNFVKDISLSINDGKFVSLKVENEDDEESIKLQKFIKGLNLTEDIIKVLEFVYLK